MLAEDHIVAWIESDRDSYNLLLQLSRTRDRNPAENAYIALKALSLVANAYRHMVTSGDASRDDPYNASDLLRAATLLAEWKAPE